MAAKHTHEEEEEEGAGEQWDVTTNSDIVCQP
jgi:hypothetical protein